MLNIFRLRAFNLHSLQISSILPLNKSLKRKQHTFRCHRFLSLWEERWQPCLAIVDTKGQTRLQVPLCEAGRTPAVQGLGPFRGGRAGFCRSSFHFSGLNFLQAAPQFIHNQRAEGRELVSCCSCAAAGKPYLASALPSPMPHSSCRP